MNAKRAKALRKKARELGEQEVEVQGQKVRVSVRRLYKMLKAL